MPQIGPEVLRALRLGARLDSTIKQSARSILVSAAGGPMRRSSHYTFIEMHQDDTENGAVSGNLQGVIKGLSQTFHGSGKRWVRRLKAGCWIFPVSPDLGRYRSQNDGKDGTWTLSRDDRKKGLEETLS